MTANIQATTKNLKFLDSLRGFAAIYVMLGHARWLLWEGYSTYLTHPTHYSLFGKLLVFLSIAFRFGHEVVLFFFVLSGFVIHLKYSSALLKNPNYVFNYKEYFFKRLKRIYPPFIFALFITLLLDSIGKSLGFPIYFGTSNIATFTTSIHSDLSFITFLGNLAFLQESYVNIFGTNGPLWSLKYEWWFYMLYPILFFFTRKSLTITSISLTLIGLASIFSFIDFIPLKEVFAFLPCWWLGCIAADIYTGRLKRKEYIILLPLFLIAILSILFYFKGGIIGDYIWSIFFFILTLHLSLLSKSESLTILSKFHFLGTFSYTLYVIHFPILIFLSGYAFKLNNSQLPNHFGYVLLGVSISLVLAWLCHFIVEKPFITKRKE